MVGKIMIAKFVRNFDVELVDNQKLGAIQEATLRPADGPRCLLTQRN